MGNRSRADFNCGRVARISSARRGSISFTMCMISNRSRSCRLGSVTAPFAVTIAMGVYCAPMKSDFWSRMPFNTVRMEVSTVERGNSFQ